jgi:hypothetical protein
MIKTNSNLEKKTEIARDYVGLHKEFDTDGTAFETIYSNLFGCLYGAVELIDEETGEHQVEISSLETNSGNSVLFTFIDPDYAGNRFPFVSEMKSEGFTNLDILLGLEDGEVLRMYDISEDEAEEMHSYLQNLPDRPIKNGSSISEWCFG